MTFFDLIGEPRVRLRLRPSAVLRKPADSAQCVLESPPGPVGDFILGGRPWRT